MIPVNMWPHGNTVAADRPCVRRDGVDSPGVGRAAAAVDAAFEKFWSAHNPQDAAKAAQTIVGLAVAFDDTLARLERGRSYSAEVKRGSIRLQRRTSLGEFYYDLDVPQAYDPARKYQVRFQLHGGVMMRETGEPAPAAAAADAVRARRRRADLRPADRVARRAVVERGADREPRRDPRQRQADLQRRREPRRARRRVGRRHRAVLRRDARHHAVRELPAA